jgi:tRNA A37 threonylcarbamoyladenosine dehydratase
MVAPPLFHRSQLLLGERVMARLATTRVILVGIGGVGSWTAEGLVRSGIGHLTMVDSDTICITNVNRQLQATTLNVGKSKVDELAMRLRTINPEADIVAHNGLYTESTKTEFDLARYDYVLDAIDSLSPKLGLIIDALATDATLFSCMGASAKIDPTQVRTSSIWATENCPLARRIRKRLRRHKVSREFQVVHSSELLQNAGQESACGTDRCFCPRFVEGPDGQPQEAHEWCSHKAFINGSLVTVTAAFGMALASLVIADVTRLCTGQPGPARASHKVRKRMAATDESALD